MISLAAETDLNFIGMLGEVSLSSRKLSLLWLGITTVVGEQGKVTEMIFDRNCH